jgi:hypothetical protein
VIEREPYRYTVRKIVRPCRSLRESEIVVRNIVQYGLGVAVLVIIVSVLHITADVQAQGKKGIVAPKNPNAEVKLGPAEVKMTAEAWYAEFKADFTGARTKYAGKVIELNGKVVSFSEDFGTRLKMEGDKSGATFPCYTVDRKPWLKVTPGATIKVKGIVPLSGSVGDLGSVQITDAGKYEALTLTASQLAAEHAKSRKDANAKYDRKWCNLSGDFLETKDAPNGRQAFLKSGNDVEVVCFSGSLGKDDPIAGLKKGTKVKLFGQLIVNEREEKKVYLIDAMLSEPRSK